MLMPSSVAWWGISTGVTGRRRIASFTTAWRYGSLATSCSVTLSLAPRAPSISARALAMAPGLRSSSAIAHSTNGLTEGDNRRGNNNLSTTHEVFLQILQADLKVKLTSSSNNMLTRFLDCTEDHRIRLCQTLQTFD
nr:unnamed protein product [Digitaria exilis]